MAIELIAVAIGEWLLFEIFLHSKLFNGPEQFVIHQFECLLVDAYFMIYCPFVLIRMSVRGQWAGWGQGRNTRRGKYFYFVRKPDPTEEFKRKGYFLKTGQFFYMKKKTKIEENVSENSLRLQSDHSVFVIREPENGKDIYMSSTFDLGMDSD
jgi:hypothetical protein